MNIEKFSLLQCSEETLKKFDINARNKTHLITTINESIYQKCARTSQEKFDVLELRDKILKLIRYEIQTNQADQNVEVVLLGTCQDMCPEKERYSREFMSLTSKWETLNDHIDYRLMIKEYSRSSADQDLPLSNELRPIDVLYETMIYIIDEIISKIASDSVSMDEADWYDFAWNRSRAIRKELSQQRLLLNDHNTQNPKYKSNQNEVIRRGLGGVVIIEQCARFHIFIAYKLSSRGPKVFSFKLNEDHLKNCFQSLRQYYEATVSRDSSLEPSPNETEFRSYIILLNLQQSDIMSEILNWPANIRNSPHVKFSLAAYVAFNSKNYVRFFRLIKSPQCTYLQACILHRYVCKMRCEAFKIIFTSFKDQKEKVYPLNKLTELLGFDTADDVYEYCDVFELDTDEVNIIMRSSNYTCFTMTKPNEGRFTVRHSKLLVDNKFKNNSLLTNEKCLSQIIRGHLTGNKPSTFGSNASSIHQLTTSFDENDYYFGNEINELLEQLKPTSAVITKNPLSGSLKSNFIAPNVTAVKRVADRLVKKAIKVKEVPIDTLGLKLEKKRRSSVSSDSSTSSESKKKIENFIHKGATVANFGNLKSQEEKSIFPKSQSSGLFGAEQDTSKINPFTKLVVNKSDNNSLTTNVPKPLLWQQQQTAISPEETTRDKPEPKNLFEHLIKKNDQLDEADRKEKQLTLKTESFYQSMLLERTKEVVMDFYRSEEALRQIELEMTNEIVDWVVRSSIQNVFYEIVSVLKSDEEAEKMRQKVEMENKRESLMRLQQANLLIEEVFDSLVSSIISEDCTRFLAFQHETQLIIYDDILCSVFQTEFDIILKQIASELNHELAMDRLTQLVYFNNDRGLIQSSLTTPVTYFDNSSIFLTDLRTLMHECIHECTRLNLNVNRELYFELKQAILLNQKKHLFRKWRLKLSLKLLKGVHKRASLDQQRNKRTPTRKSDPLPPDRFDKQLNLITFIKTYGRFLLNNLSRFQEMMTFMVCGRDDEHEGSMQQVVVHSEEYQMHLTWNMNMNNRHFLYGIMLENYFNIIQNHDEKVLLPAHVNLELFCKLVIAMPRLNTDDPDIEALKRWLLTKFFAPKETSHSENLSVTMLHSNAYGLRFFSKLCTSDMNEHELVNKLNKRELYGTNSLIYVLMPCEDERRLHEYMTHCRKDFFKILRLFNENLDLTDRNSIDSYQFMFISYLDNAKETQEVIKFILGKSCYLFCVLEGDVTKDNRVLQRTYQNFLKQVYIQNSKIFQSSRLDYGNSSRNYEQINNVMTLANIFEMTIVKFFEYLLYSSKNIYIPFKALISEYNSRLNVLIKTLTREEYRLLAWPIPELSNIDLAASSNWTLRYWNTNECFDDVLRDQLFNLMYLTEDDIFNEDLLQSTEDLVELDLVEEKFRNYIDMLFLAKYNSCNFTSLCAKSKYQLESSISKTFINMKKITVNKTNEHSTKITKCDIQWPQLILAVLEYLLRNLRLNFKARKQLSLDEFVFYCNINELKAYDWINNVTTGELFSSLNASPTSSISSNNSDNLNHSTQITNKLRSKYMAAKYPKKSESETFNKRRRVSEDREELEQENKDASNLARSPLIDQSSLEETYHLGEIFLSAKNQRLTVPDTTTAESSDFDNKFQDFLSLLSSEKNQSQKFNTKLVESSGVDDADEIEVLDMSFELIESGHYMPKRVKILEPQENSEVPMNDKRCFDKNLEEFLGRLQEEKIKNEKFSAKLNSMLNY